MIKLIECKSSSIRKIQVKHSNNTLEFAFTNMLYCSHAVSIETLNHGESITLKYSRTYNSFVQSSNTFNSRDTQTFYENYYGVENNFSIIIAKYNDDIVILVYGATIDENLTECEILHERGDWLYVMQKHLPQYVEAYRKKKAAKVNLMRQVSPLDSISYLEKQVDILSELVLSLIQNKEPEWLPLFQLVMSETTSVSDTNIDDMIEKLYSEKLRIRDVQTEYFKAIADDVE